MNNIKLPGSRFCERDNKPWAYMQHYNSLPGWAMTGSAQFCIKGQSLQHCLFSLHGGYPTPHPAPHTPMGISSATTE